MSCVRRFWTGRDVTFLMLHSSRPDLMSVEVSMDDRKINRREYNQRFVWLWWAATFTSIQFSSIELIPSYLLTHVHCVRRHACGCIYVSTHMYIAYRFWKRLVPLWRCLGVVVVGSSHFFRSLLTREGECRVHCHLSIYRYKCDALLWHVTF